MQIIYPNARHVYLKVKMIYSTVLGQTKLIRKQNNCDDVIARDKWVIPVPGIK